MTGSGRPRVLVVDDEVNIRNALVKILGGRGFHATAAASAHEALGLVEQGQYQVVVTDLRLPGMDGIDLIKSLKASHPDIEVIVVTAFGAVETAVEAMKQGAYDYITKPIDHPRLALLIEKAVERHRMLAENAQLRERLSVREQFEHVVGTSPAMRRIYEIVDQVANTRATVLLQGESGTGKELIARAIHQRSDRRERPFVAINCGALPESLLESELFGHERGAFTGATAARQGRIELADGGTLFLDEVSEMSPRSQVEFLRVLETHEFRRLGGSQLIRVDVRVVAASNRDLWGQVEHGAFREDLYYRLNVIPITLPPLRERPEDIPLLAEVFLREFAAAHGRPPKQFHDDTLTMLNRYTWPGNIRELRNLIERLVITVHGGTLMPDHLPQHVGTMQRRPLFLSIPLGTRLREIERQVIARTLQEITQHREQAARILGISPRALHYKLKRYHLSGEVPFDSSGGNGAGETPDVPTQDM